ncbi:MAG: hypothetical protein IPM29_26570 [Planctomycetes bacterium]|nr:hypothetical protein [Planctomycetota bacterium]
MLAPCPPRGALSRRHVPPGVCLSIACSLFLAACGGGGGGTPGNGTPRDPNPPELRFVSLQTDETAVQAGTISIAWVANDVDDDATVSIFADVDGDLGTTSDRHTLVDEVAEADGQVSRVTVDLVEVPDGTFAVVGRVRDGKGGELRVAAPGQMIVEDRSLVAPIASGTVEITAHLPRPDGSFDVLGRFSGQVAFDVRNRIESSGRNWDTFVASYTRRGVLRWLSVFECTGDMDASAFLREANGDLLIAGSFGGILTLPGGTTARGQDLDVFLARVSADGEQLWVGTAASPNRDLATDIAFLSDGSFVVAGTFNVGNTTYGIDFGNDRNGQPVSLPSAGIGDGFVARYESDGKPVWARSVGGRATDRALAVAVLAGDRIVVGGSFEGTASFGGGSVQHTASGDADAYLAEWSPGGTLVRVDTFVGTGAEEIVDVARCAGGDVAVLANSGSTFLDIAGQTSLALATGKGVTLARFAPDGLLRWAHGEAVGPGDCAGSRLLPLDDDGLLVAGTYADGAVFGAGGPTLGALGRADGFLTSRAVDGSLRWLRRFGTADVASGMVVSIGPDRTILVTGDRGTADLRVYAERGNVTLPATGNGSDFIVRFNPDVEFGRSPDLSRRVAGRSTLTRGRVTMNIDGLTATLFGFDDAELTPAIRQLFEEHPLVGLLVLQEANGPDRGSAHLEAARLLASRGIETHIPFNASVYGGGIDLFLGGRRRTAFEGAIIGVRSWIDESGLTGYDIRNDRGQAAHVPYLEFYQAMGVPTDYYWFYIQTPRNTWSRLTRADLERYSLVTE